MDEKKTILVIGGCGGIGTEIVDRLRMDYRLCVYDKNPEVLIRYENHIDVLPVCGDILDEKSLDRLEKLLIKEREFYGIIFAMGIMIPGNVTEIEEDDWQRTFDVNLNSVYKVCHRLIPYLIQNKRSHIIAISSHIGVVGAYNLTAYCTTKAALIEMIRCIALDYGDYGLAANCISPGFSDTELLRGALKTFATNKKWMFATGGLPKQRIQIEDIVIAVEMLIKQNSMNGSNIVIDAGYIAR